MILRNLRFYMDIYFINDGMVKHVVTLHYILTCCHLPLFIVTISTGSSNLLDQYTYPVDIVQILQ